MKGVIRIEQPEKNSFGWQGRIYFEIDGARPPSRFFSDRLHGGKKKAQEQCAAWVLRQHKKHKQVYLDGVPVVTKARTPSGVVGVYHTPQGGLVVRATYKQRSLSKTLKEDATLETAARARRRLYQQLVTEAQRRRR
jgi:hypothetical protein